MARLSSVAQLILAFRLAKFSRLDPDPPVPLALRRRAWGTELIMKSVQNPVLPALLLTPFHLPSSLYCISTFR